jgi:hypothetical protein
MRFAAAASAERGVFNLRLVLTPAQSLVDFICCADNRSEKANGV